MKCKNLLLLFSVFLASAVSHAQKNDKNPFVGVWVSDGTSVWLTFSMSGKNKLTLSVVDTTSGEKMRIKKFQIKGDTVVTEEIFRSTKWVTHNKYYLSGSDSLINEITNNKQQVIFIRRE